MNASCAASIGTVIVSMPRFSASSSASVTLPSLEYRDGMSTPVTRSGPSASTAIAATSDESIPPDSPMSTSLEAVLARRSRGCRATSAS